MSIRAYKAISMAKKQMLNLYCYHCQKNHNTANLCNRPTVYDFKYRQKIILKTTTPHLVEINYKYVFVDFIGISI